jgi:superfamily I DNA/RNA helicase/RecB family exonuclease
VVTLTRLPSQPPVAVSLDPDQALVVAHRGPVLRVLGGPGTGKTLLAAEIVADRVAAGEVRAEQCLVLAPTRRAAARLRDSVTSRVAATTSGPLARTPHSLAFGLLRRRAALLGEEAPRLISGPEQDVILRELLAGYAAEPALAPTWPAGLAEAVGTRTFRGELRDLLMRTVELGLGADGLRAAGVAHERPEWLAVAHVLEDYDEVTALSSPGALDPAWLVGAAAARLADDDTLRRTVAEEVGLVVVDDAQELTPAAAALVRALVDATGAPLVLLGDPDAATQTFRGAEPHLMLTGWAEAPVIRLGHGHRLPAAIQTSVERVAWHIGSVGEIAHRRPDCAAGEGAVEAHVFRTAAQEAAWVADLLRRRHLLEGAPWSSMAVIVRGSAAMSTLDRVLRRASVPTSLPMSMPVREHPAVRPLLMIARAVLEPGPDGTPAFTPDDAVDLLGSTLGGADAVALRRTRRALRRVELAAGGGRPSAELLAEALADPLVSMRLGPEGSALRRVVRVVTAARSAAAAPDATIETLLWAMWTATDLGSTWQRAALQGGASGRRADANLDAVVTLFDTAARYVDRLPGQGPAGFLEHILGQDLAADTLAAHAPDQEAVALVTPADAAGREWDLVCVIGVQEGSWPDPRLRGVLLGAPDLVDVARGRPFDRRAARTAVLHDETRLFLVATSRARRRLVVTAVRSEDQQPSVLVDVIAPLPDGSQSRMPTDPPRPLSVPGLVAELRRALVEPDARRRGAAASTLAAMARAGVTGADPANWWPLLDVSDDRPRRAEDQVVRVSPSRLDRFGKCQLQWFLSGCGGQGPSLGASEIGVLVHDIAHDLGDVSATEYEAEVRARWGSLGLGNGWLAARSLASAVTMTGRLAGHVQRAAQEGWTKDSSEVRVDATIGRARITGRVDRVERDEQGRVRIIDLKTGSSKPSAAEIERHRQLGSYQLAVQEGALGADVTSGGAALLQLGKAATGQHLQTQAALADDPDPDWAAQALAADAEVMAGATFTATPGGGLCGTCQVASSCPARDEGRRLR